MTSCDLEMLAAYRDGALDAPGREALERHALGCRRCRGMLLVLGPGEPARRAPWRIWIPAAAALLVAATLALRGEKAPAGSVPAPQAPAFRKGAPAYLAPGMDLVLEAGARAEAAEGRVRLEAGRLWLEAGRPMTLELPGMSLRVKGAVAARVQSAKTSWFLGEALAGEAPAAEIWILRGEATAKDKTLRAGMKLVLTGEGWQEEAAPAEELADLSAARTLALASAPGRDPAGSPPVWRWVAVLAKREGATEVGLSFPVDGAWRQWVPGLAASASSRDVVELAWDGERLVGRVNGVQRLGVEKARLAETLRAAPEPRWELSAWGGGVTVAQSRLLEGGR